MNLRRIVTTPDYEGEGRRVSDQPWWVRSIAFFGFPTACAAFLVWVGATEVPKMKAQGQEQLAATKRIETLQLEHQEQSAAMYRMLQRICSNTARNENERQRCFDK